MPYHISSYMVPQTRGEEMESHNYIIRGYSETHSNTYSVVLTLKLL